MDQERSVEAPHTITREAFLARFARVPSGLDPDQVFALFTKFMSRVDQVEQQAKRVSAPFVMEVTLHEAATICARATEASERAYQDIVGAAQEEAERVRSTAQRRADEILRSAREELARAQAAAEQEATRILEQAKHEAVEVANMAQAILDEARTFAAESPRYSDQRAMDRDWPSRRGDDAPPIAPLVGPGDDWPRVESPIARPPVPPERTRERPSPVRERMSSRQVPPGDSWTDSQPPPWAPSNDLRNGGNERYPLPDWLDR